MEVVAEGPASAVPPSIRRERSLSVSRDEAFGGFSVEEYLAVRDVVRELMEASVRMLGAQLTPPPCVPCPFLIVCVTWRELNTYVKRASSPQTRFHFQDYCRDPPTKINELKQIVIILEEAVVEYTEQSDHSLGEELQWDVR